MRHKTESAGGGEGTAGRLRRCARLIPGLLLLAGIGTELVAPRDVTISALFSAAPIAAAALQSTRATIITGILATGTFTLLARYWDTASGLVSEGRAITVATVSVIAVAVSFVLRRNDAELASARIVAEAVQLAVLPAPPTRVGGLAMATHYRAAQVDARIGGDFYAVEETPHGVRILVGDVRGKGLSAVEAVVIVVGAFREAAEQEATLIGVASRLDRALQREGRRQLGNAQFEGFTTAVLVEIPADEHGGTAGTRSLRVVNRGHPGPLLLAGGRAVVLDASIPALPLGMTELGVWPDHLDEFRFPRGAQLLLYTDGLSESRDSEGVFYDPEQRLTGRRFADPGELLEYLIADVEAHTGGAGEDDMALLAVAHGTRAPVTLRSGTDQLG